MLKPTIVTIYILLVLLFVNLKRTSSRYRDLVRISKLWVQIFKYATKTVAKQIFV